MSRFSIPRVIELPRPARTWSDKALLLKRPGTSISFSRNNGPSDALRAQLRRSKMAEELNYKGYRLLVSPVGKGWRAMIFPPGSSSALPESPATLEKSPKEAIVAEARKIVDERLNVQN
jgi:hypothetical protein